MLAEATNPRKRFGSQSHLCQPNRIKFTGYLNLINLAFIAEIVLVGGMLPFFFSANVWIFQQLLQLILIETKKSERAVSLQTKIVSRSRFIKRRLFAKNEDIAKQKTALASKFQPYRSSNLGQTIIIVTWEETIKTLPSGERPDVSLASGANGTTQMCIFVRLVTKTDMGV